MTRLKIEICSISNEDLHELQTLAISTFVETYAWGNTEENLKNYLDEKFSLAQLKSELLDDRSAFYFAKVDDLVLGYIKLNSGTAQTELKNLKALEIERIYVQKIHQGKRVGQALFQKSLALAKAKKSPYIWLGVWEKNPKAVSFYKKHGFVQFDRHTFKLGEEEQRDLLMKLII